MLAVIFGGIITVCVVLGMIAGRLKNIWYVLKEIRNLLRDNANTG